MKSNYKWLMALLLVVALAVGCAPAKTTFEGRKNRLEAFLVDRASGYHDVVAPNIYGLEDADKATLINALSHAIVADKEDILIDYLNQQWPNWRQSSGFLIEHLAARVERAEKLAAVKPQRTVDAQSVIVATRLAQFYEALDRLLASNGIAGDSLYVPAEAWQIDWQYREGDFYLTKVSLTLVDLPNKQYYALQYDGAVLSLQSSSANTGLYGHWSRAELKRLVDERALQALLPAEVSEPIAVALSGWQGDLENANLALKRADAFVAVDGTSSGQVVAKLNLKWQREALSEQIDYLLMASW